MSSRHIRGPFVFNSVKRLTDPGDYTVVSEAAVIVIKGSGQATGIVLPAAAGAVGGNGRRLVYVLDGKGDAGSNNITVTVAGAGTIDGASSFVISENYGAQVFFDTGLEWVALQPPAVSPTEIAFLNGVVAGTAAASKALVLDASLNITGIGRMGAAGFRVEDVGTTNGAGTVIGNAAAITHRLTLSTGDDTVGLILPVAVAGDEFQVYNLAATAGLKIYPQVNSAINGGTANAAITIEGKTLSKFIATSTTNWAAMYTANS